MLKKTTWNQKFCIRCDSDKSIFQINTQNLINIY